MEYSRLIMSKYIYIFIAILLATPCVAQTYRNLEELQNISIENSMRKRQEKKEAEKPEQKAGKKEEKPKAKAERQEVDINSIFDLAGNTGDMNAKEVAEEVDEVGGTLFDDSFAFEASWGDPVARPEIRAGRASNLFGPVRYYEDGRVRWHRGFDYAAPKGTPVMSVGNGTVHSTGRHFDFGIYVIIKHKAGSKTYYSFYAHLSSADVRRGKKVSKGTVIGKSGTTGNAHNLAPSEAHLHFECRLDPKHTVKTQLNPNTIVKTKFYSEDPDNKSQYHVGVKTKKSGTDALDMFEL